MKIEYLVLAPIVIKNIHEGSIYLSYDKKEDAEKQSENGKFQIIKLESK